MNNLPQTIKITKGTHEVGKGDFCFGNAKACFRPCVYINKYKPFMAYEKKGK